MSKIFCIGSNKTGTTSLTSALQTLGFRVCPESITFNPNSNYFMDQKNGNYESLFDLVKKYDAFEDRPWNHSNFYQVLDSKFPNSKFILTIRDTKNWVESYRRWSKQINLKQQWFYTTISQICYGIDDFLGNEKIMIEKYEKRNNEIIEYFSNTNKLLILDLEKNNDINNLCVFLDKPITNKKIPHLNRTK